MSGEFSIVRLTNDNAVKEYRPYGKEFSDHYNFFTEIVCLSYLKGIKGIVDLGKVDIESCTIYLSKHQYTLKTVDRKLLSKNFDYVLRNTLRTVAILHSKGIIHNDIKLDNVMADIIGGGIETILIDFNNSYFYPINRSSREIYDVKDLVRTECEKLMIFSDAIPLGNMFHYFLNEFPISASSKEIILSLQSGNYTPIELCKINNICNLDYYTPKIDSYKLDAFISTILLPYGVPEQYFVCLIGFLTSDDRSEEMDLEIDVKLYNEIVKNNYSKLLENIAKL